MKRYLIYWEDKLAELEGNILLDITGNVSIRDIRNLIINSNVTNPIIKFMVELR